MRKEDRKKVLITLNGNYAAADQGDDRVEMVIPGHLMRKDEQVYLRFDEPAEESGVEPVHTLITYPKTKDSAQVVRTGPIRSRMIFEVGKRSECHYDMGMGVLELSLVTTKLEIREEKEQILLMIHYSLDAGQGQVVDCAIDLTVREKVSVHE
ncbi:MAG: DUF1934 domain-containing protein [Lachnospiraceae bacterium]|nr:DUF1934 domain-containing protein [Lachnospiraceae bacterium]